MTIPQKRALGITLFLVQWTLLYLGLTGSTWAWNLFIFREWIAVVIGSLAAISRYFLEQAGKFQKQEPSFPKWVGATSDYALVIVLAATGHFFYAVLVIIEQLLEQYLLSEPSKKTPTEDLEGEWPDPGENAKLVTALDSFMKEAATRSKYKVN
jgi:hypothetical protein